MPAPLFELSDHAATVIARREIATAWIERAVMRPDKVEPHPVDRALRHALVTIPERDGRILRVVYNPSSNPPKIVTAYFDRKLRGTL